MLNRPVDVEALLLKRGLTRAELAPAVMQRITMNMSFSQAVRDLGFSEDEVDHVLIEMVEVFGAAMRAAHGVRRRTDA